MVTPRAGHTATLLANGKVLVAGGYSAINHRVSSAELYDPASGAFTPTGVMIAPRADHTATLLPDGKVLIAGGSSPSETPAKNAEIYDPSTGTFAAIPDMTGPHACHEANPLPNGRVLISGGFDPLAAELYDPVTSRFTAAGKYARDEMTNFNACKGAVSVTLSDGRVLIVWQESTAELYDPAGRSFAPTGTPAALGYYDGMPAAIRLMNGNVLVAGGGNDSGINNDAELYNPATGIFTATGNMTAGRINHTATLLPNGHVLMAGSHLYGGSSLASAELYDPAAGTFSATVGMSTARALHTATLLSNGKVLIAGGSIFGVPTPNTELFTPSVQVPLPVLLSLSASAQGAILHAGSNRIVSPADPATPGEALEIYCTGLAAASILNPPQVIIGGRIAEVLYFGGAPGYPGLYQINTRTPIGVAAGPSIPVRLTYLGLPSNEVTAAIR